MAEVNEQTYELVPVGDLTEHPENPNRGDVDVIVESVEANGFFGAVLVQKPRGNRKRGRIIAGEHRWRAAKQSGLAEVPVLWADVSDEEALRIMLADNESARRATYDQSSLTDLLQRLDATSDGLMGCVFSRSDLDDVLKTLPTFGDADDEDPELITLWGVMITCETEADQLTLLDRFSGEGLDVKAIIP